MKKLSKICWKKNFINLNTNIRAKFNTSWSSKIKQRIQVEHLTIRNIHNAQNTQNRETLRTRIGHRTASLAVKAFRPSPCLKFTVFFLEFLQHAYIRQRLWNPAIAGIEGVFAAKLLIFWFTNLSLFPTFFVLIVILVKKLLSISHIKFCVLATSAFCNIATFRHM